MLSKKIKTNNGITLVALVITIIILLILATISIQALTNTGLFGKAQEAKEKSQNAELNQQIKLNEFENIINSYAETNNNEQIKFISKIKMEKESVTLNEGDTLNLVVEILPEDANNKDIAWSSSNSDVATIEQDGKLTAVSEGTATITATAKDGSNIKASCEVTVLKELVIFDYKNGGAQYEMEYTSTGYSVGPTISNNEVYGNCTTTGQGWKQLLTKSTFDLTKYKYLSIEGIFRGTYNKFAELYLNITDLYSPNLTSVDAKYRILPITSEYSSFYIDISENKWNSKKVGISPKMKGDAVRVLKFTNIKPEGTYAGKIF